jgi:hypothetical protein
MGWGAPRVPPKDTPLNIPTQTGQEGQSSGAQGGHGYPEPEPQAGSRAKRPAEEEFLETERKKTKQGAEVPRDGIFQRWLERFGV